MTLWDPGAQLGRVCAVCIKSLFKNECGAYSYSCPLMFHILCPKDHVSITCPISAHAYMLKHDIYGNVFSDRNSRYSSRHARQTFMNVVSFRWRCWSWQRIRYTNGCDLRGIYFFWILCQVWLRCLWSINIILVQGGPKKTPTWIGCLMAHAPHKFDWTVVMER